MSSLIGPIPAAGIVEDLIGEISDLLRTRSYLPAQLASLHGKLRFARAQCFPRAGAAALNTLVKHMSRAGGRFTIGAELARALSWWPKFFRLARPRVIRTPTEDPPAILFTDGAYHTHDAAIATVGAYLCGRDIRPRAGGAIVPDELRLRWSGGSDSQVVGQAEILPVLVAMRLWGDLLDGRKLICFIDNESAKGALVRGYSPVKASADLIQLIGLEEASRTIFTWYARVPSASNPADGPSRLDFTGARVAGRHVADDEAQWHRRR